MRPPSSTLVIVDGGLASLIACAAAREAAIVAAGGSAKAPEAGRCIAWLPPSDGPNGALREAAAGKHAEMFGLSLVRAPASAGLGHAEHETSTVVAAAYAAARAGCEAVVWPVQCAMGNEIDLDAAARASDRALLVSRLIDLDAHAHGGATPRIETPYADFTDHQLAELALDMDLPPELCWWWRSDFVKRVLESEKPELPGGLAREPERQEIYAECLRWAPVLREVGCPNLTV